MKYQVGGLLVDTDNHTVTDKQQSLELTGVNLLMFLAMVKHYPTPLAGDTLVQEVWQKSHVSTDTIKKRFSLLKKELQGVGMEDLIKSLPNQSYVLSVKPTPINQDTITASHHIAPKKRSKVITTVTLILAALALLLLIQKQDSPPELYDPVTGKTLVAPKGDN